MYQLICSSRCPSFTMIGVCGLAWPDQSVVFGSESRWSTDRPIFFGPAGIETYIVYILFKNV